MPLAVTLIINSTDGRRELPLNADRLTIGRTELSTLVINDEGLSRIHASINRDGDRVWILDENSTNGSFVNGSPVPPVGIVLKNNDQISIGNHTTIQVLLGAQAASQPTQTSTSAPGVVINTSSSTSAARSPYLLMITAGVVVTIFLIGMVAFGAHAWKAHLRDKEKKAEERRRVLDDPDDDAETEASSLPSENTNGERLTGTSEQPTLDSSTLNSPTLSPQNSATSPPLVISSITPVNASSKSTLNGHKLYLQMSEDEKMEFIEESAQHISTMMGNRQYAFTPEVLKYIKQYVDGYARRVGNNQTRLWGEDLNFMFARARGQFSPYIVQAFNRQGVPPVVGLYLCVIETEYHNIQSENFAGAAGLFQFIGPTAEAYGVPRGERTNVEKMAPAAAKYIAQRIAEFGTDSMSVALGIAGYNRNPDSVRRDLVDVLNSENKERSFWTLVANSTKLDHWFQGENIKYVPKYFAAAIVGEHPWAFGLDMRPLSTYTDLPAKQPTGVAAATANSNTVTR